LTQSGWKKTQKEKGGGGTSVPSSMARARVSAEDGALRLWAKKKKPPTLPEGSRKHTPHNVTEKGVKPLGRETLRPLLARKKKEGADLIGDDKKVLQKKKKGAAANEQ